LVHHLNQHLVTVVARILDNFHSLLTSFDYVDETEWLSCRYFQKKIAKELYLFLCGMSRIEKQASCTNTGGLLANIVAQ